MKISFFLKMLLFIVVVLIITPIAVAAQTAEPLVEIDNIITAITPLIIYGITWVVQKIKPTLMGWNIVWVVVPILSLVGSTILVMIDQASSFWSQFIWNFLSVVVAQMISQLSAEKRLANEAHKLKLKNGH